MSDDVPVPVAAPMGMAQFTASEGQRKMLALAEEFVAVCRDRKKREMPWLTKIGNGEHLHIEAWQYLGQRAGVTGRTAETRAIRHPVTGDYEGEHAIAEAILVATGQVVGRAEQVCMADEVHAGGTTLRWVTKTGAPLRHAIMGMAQTRAQSRVLASVLRFIAEMAGFVGTPAEEMDGVTPDANGGKPAVKPPTRKSEAAKPAAAEPDTIAAAVAAGRVAEGYVMDVGQNTGTNAAGPYTMTKAKVLNEWFSTFSTSEGKLLLAAKAQNTPVKIAWQPKGDFKNIVAVKMLADEFAAAPAGKPAPREAGDEEPPAADGMQL